MATVGGSIRDIHAGPLTKMGGNIKSWRKRWVVLKSNRSLQYFKDAGKVPAGTISLDDINFNVQPGSKNSNCAWPKNCDLECSLEITTTNRTYFMFADSVREAEEWISILQKYADEASKARGNGNASLPSRYHQKMGGKAGDLATPTAVPNSDSHTPKMYKKKDRRLPTKRFNTVSDNGKDDDDEDFKGGDSDGERGGVMDGELDMQRFERQSELSLTTSRSNNEAIYDVAQSTEERPRVTSPNSNNNNGSERSSSSTTNLHDSLYDLVGRINAGDDCSEDVKKDSIVEDQEFYDVIKQEPKQEQDLYEPMSSEPSTPSHSSSTVSSSHLNSSPVRVPNVAMSLPSSSLSPKLPPPNTAAATLGKTSSAGSVPRLPSLDLYESMEAEQSQALYEEIEGTGNEAIAEADSDDEEVERILSTSSIDLPPPIPKPRGLTRTEADEQVTYDNAPVLPQKVPSRSTSPLPPIPPPPLTSTAMDEPQEFYGNAPFIPPKPSSTTTSMTNILSPVDKSPRNMKSPVPTPRKMSKGSPQTLEKHRQREIQPPEGSEEIYDDTVSVLSTTSSGTSSGLVNSMESTSPSNQQASPGVPSRRSVEERQFKNMKEEQTTEGSVVQSQGQVTAAIDTDTADSKSPLPPSKEDQEDKDKVLQSPVKYRTSPKKISQRVHSATVGPYDQGIAMFHKRADVLSSVEGTDHTGTLKLLTNIDSLNVQDKTNLAATLREIEAEKHLASEEKFKWERERLKLEEERRRFEEEKRKFEEEKKRMMKQLKE